MLQNAASPPKDRYFVTKSTRILKPRSIRGLTALMAVIAALPRHGAPPECSFLQISQGWESAQPSGMDHLDYDLQSFTFAGKLVIASSSKALHLSHPKHHCLAFNWAKTPFLLYKNILLSAYRLSVPLMCQRLSSETRHQTFLLKLDV